MQPPLIRIAAIDAELTSLYGRARVLLDERGRLVAALPGPSGPAAATGAAGPGTYGPGPATAVGPGVRPVPEGAGGPVVGGGPGAAGRFPGGAGGARPVREASAVSVQTVLLALGGVLLGTASLVFLAVAWSRAGVAGRALVLLSLTAAALLAPGPLIRRRLTATAETIAAVGVALAALDLWAAWRLDLLAVRDLPAAGYAAGSVALLAAGAAAYSLALPLRGPRPLAVALAQLPLPLLSFADPSPTGIALALLGTAVLDASLVRRGTERELAAGCGTAAWALSVAVALPAAYGPSVPAMLAATLAGAAALAAAALLPAPARDVAIPAGVLVLAAVLIAAVRAPLGDLLAPALTGVATVATAAALRGAWRRGTVLAGAVLLAGTALAPLAAAVEALSVPAATAAAPWSGVAALPAPVTADATVAALATALLAGAGLALAAVLLDRPAAALPTAAAGALLAVPIAPVALSLPLPATLTLLAILTTAAAAASLWRSRWAVVSSGLGASTVAWALATEVATLVVLAGLAVLAAAVAGAGRRGGLRAGGAAVAVLALTAEAVAVPAAAGATTRVTAFVLLGLVAAAAGAAALLRARPAESRAIELAALPAAALAPALASAEARTASAAFALLGAILLAVSLRPDRRPAAYAGVASVQLALWIALFVADVDAPEAYTGPLSALLLAIGTLRRRTGAGSWSAYGPGLLLTAVPSLLEATATGGPRTLLLGAAALALVLLGARARLQAPLTVGAGVLLVLALDEAGPAVLGLLADLPRWVPPAVGGAILVATGATYERRLRDLRRARAAYDRLA